MLSPTLLPRIDEELARLGRTRRWLSLEIGRHAGFVRDIARGKSRGPRHEDLLRIAERLGKPIDYFTGEANFVPSSSSTINRMPTNPAIVTRAEVIADMVMTRMVRRPGAPDFTNEMRGRIVAAAMDALIEADRMKQSLPDEMIPILSALIHRASSAIKNSIPPPCGKIAGILP